MSDTSPSQGPDDGSLSTADATANTAAAHASEAATGLSAASVRDGVGAGGVGAATASSPAGSRGGEQGVEEGTARAAGLLSPEVPPPPAESPSPATPAVAAPATPATSTSTSTSTSPRRRQRQRKRQQASSSPPASSLDLHDPAMVPAGQAAAASSPVVAAWRRLVLRRPWACGVWAAAVAAALVACRSQSSAVRMMVGGLVLHACLVLAARVVCLVHAVVFKQHGTAAEAALNTYLLPAREVVSVETAAAAGAAVGRGVNAMASWWVHIVSMETPVDSAKACAAGVVVYYCVGWVNLSTVVCVAALAALAVPPVYARNQRWVDKAAGAVMRALPARARSAVGGRAHLD